MSWLDDIVKAHEEVEAPQNFWRWAAIAAISAVVKDNVWLPRQLYKLYPNIYVMLHADSGLRKGPPVNMAAQLVESVNNTLIIQGRSSIQGMLKELGSQPTAYTEPGGKVISKSSTAFLCASELTSSIVEDKVATTILTDLYDRQYRIKHWRSILKMESFDLKNPTITLLGATNEAHTSDFFTSKDFKGGFFARTFMIYESTRNRINSLNVPLKNPIDYEKFSGYLKQLAKLTGPFQELGSRTETDFHKFKLKNLYSDEVEYYTEAGIINEEWYREYVPASDKIKDPTGTLKRFDTSVMKVAMLLSLAEKPDLIISPKAMKEAIDICETLIGNIRKVTFGKTGDERPDVTRRSIFIQELMQSQNHTISRARLIKKYWMQGDYKEWDLCAMTFQEAGAITIEMVGDSIIYRMINSEAIDWENFFKGKIK